MRETRFLTFHELYAFKLQKNGAATFEGNIFSENLVQYTWTWNLDNQKKLYVQWRM